MATVSTYVVSEATGDAAVPLQHEVIDELEGLGFTRIGLLSIRRRDEVSALARYEDDDVERALAHLRRLRQVLVSPEHDAYAVVDVADTVAVVSFATLVQSGSLIETFKLPPGRAPLPADALAKRRAYFTQAAAPGRDVAVLDGEVAPAFQAHLERVAQQGVAPAPHDDMAGLLLLAEAMLRHEEQVREQRKRLLKIARWGPWLVALALGVLLAFALGRAGVTSTPAGALVSVFVLSLLLSWLLRLAQPKINSALLRSPQRRPRFALS